MRGLLIRTETSDNKTPRWGGILVRRPFRRGFTFTEVMFAVILLGIGFIMLAGMFPVAIQQTQTTAEESSTAPIAQDGRAYGRDPDNRRRAADGESGFNKDSWGQEQKVYSSPIPATQ